MPLGELSDFPFTDRSDALAAADNVAERLDAHHAPDPGDLQGIGACRVCGFIIGRGRDGTWSHRPSVSEVQPVDDWLERHPTSPRTDVPTDTDTDSPTDDPSRHKELL